MGSHSLYGTIQRDSRLTKLQRKIKSLPEKKDLTIDELRSVGRAFNEILRERLGFDPDELKYQTGEGWDEAREELTQVQRETGKLFSELFEAGGGYEGKFFGNRDHRDQLKTALKRLPDTAVNRVNGEIHLRVEPKRTAWGGQYKIGAMKAIPTPSKTISTRLPEHLRSGEFHYDGILSEQKEASLVGAAVQRVLRREGEPVKDGESVREGMEQLTTEEEIEFLKTVMSGEDPLIDINLRILEGKSEALRDRFPDIYTNLQENDVIEEYYLGEAPRQKGVSYRKVANKVEVKDNTGRVVRFNKPLRKKHDRVRIHQHHTISATRGSGESTLLHEFSHALQTSHGIPTESSFFKELSEGSDLKSARHYSHYDTGPDPYMMDSTGRELFPRATQGLFYPVDDDYLYGERNQAKGSVKVREWITGVWLHLST